MSIKSFMTGNWRLHSRMRNHHFQVTPLFMIRSKARIFFPQIIIWSRLYDSENGETEWPRTLTQSKLSGMSDKFFAKHVTLFYSSTGNQTFIFLFLKIENKLYKEDFITLLHKKRGAVNFFVGGLVFFVTKKRVQCDPNILIPWPRCDNYGSNQLPVKLQSIYFSIVPSLHKWEQMSYLLACLGQEPSSFFLSMMISWPEKRPASWQ